MGRPSKNLAGPGPIGPAKPAPKVVAGKTDGQLWRDMRTYRKPAPLNVTKDATPVFESRCHRRTCRKKYTPSFQGQYLCDKCLAATRS